MKHLLIKNQEAIFTPKAFCQFQGRRKEGGEGELSSADSLAETDYKNRRLITLCP